MILRRLPLLLPLLLLAGLLGAVPVTAPATVPVAVADYQPSLPVNANVYYATQVKPKSKVHPTKPVDNGDVEVIRNTILDMQYGGQQVGLYSWFGRGSYTDTVFVNHLRAADDNSFRWALLNENEGQGKNPTVAQAKADLDHIYARYGKDPSYFRVGGKPVMFLYGDASDTCSAATRWRQADSANRFYLVMKVVPGYTGCSLKPQSWYGYAPANGRFQAGNSFAVSPGFNKVGESAPRLGRSVARFTADLKAMKAAAVRFRIVTTWNEWTEATGVESATEWASRSGHGAYVDAMRAVLGAALTVPAPPATVTSQTVGQDVKVSWTASSGATSYQVFRNGCLVASLNALTWTDTALADESAAYSVKAVNARGTSRRSGIRIAAAGTPDPAPARTATEGLTAVHGQRIMSTATGTGLGCGGRQRGQAVISLPASVPANATSAVVTITAFNALGTGAVTVFGAGSPVPPVAHLRYYSTRAHTNTTTVPLGTARQLVVQTGGAAAHVYVDLIGYMSPDGEGIRVNHTAPDRLFFSTRSTPTYGGTPTLKMVGTKTVTLPAQPAGLTVSAVQLRVVTTGADGPGNATVYGGSTAPGVISLAYAPSVTLTNSVLVPVGPGNTVTVSVTRNTSVMLGLEGWVAKELPPALTVNSASPRLAASTPRTSAAFVLPASAYGRVALLNVNVQRAAGYGNLSVYGDAAAKPGLQTVAFGPQQPQSGHIWVRVPANGKIWLTSSVAALLSADLVGIS